MIAENTFDEVKEKHSGAVNVQKHLIKLSYQGAEVTDDSNLGGMKLKVGSNEVSLEAKERIFANVQTPKGKIIQHELETTDDIQTAKQRHQDKVKVNRKYIKLSYGGQELNDTQQLDYLKMSEACNTVPVIAEERVTLNVTMFDKSVVPFEFVTTDTVVDCKKGIGKKTGTDEHIIKLTFNGKEIVDANTIEDVKNLAGAHEIPLVATQREEITVQMMSGNTVNLEM